MDLSKTITLMFIWVYITVRMEAIFLPAFYILARSGNLFLLWLLPHNLKVNEVICNKGLYSQSYGFSSNYVWIWELNHKEEGWDLTNWCFQIVVLKKTLESPLDCKEIQPVHSKADQCWVFFGRNDAKAETPVLWPPDVKSWLIWKDPDAGKEWEQEEKEMTEDEMVGWHHWLNGHGFG